MKILKIKKLLYCRHDLFFPALRICAGKENFLICRGRINASRNQGGAMKKYLFFQKSLILGIITLFAMFYFLACSHHLTQKTVPSFVPNDHEPATLELINILREIPELEQLLIRSIDIAKEINPYKNTNPVQSIESIDEGLK